MTPTEIKTLIENGIPRSTVDVTGAEGKFEAVVVSDVFAGLSAVKKHQAVYKIVNPQIASGAIHALSIRAYTPDEWNAER